MATYYEELPQGLVVQCYLCKGPIREFVYRHQCDVRITKDRTLPESVSYTHLTLPTIYSV